MASTKWLREELMIKKIAGLALGFIASAGLIAMACATAAEAQEVQAGATFVGEVNHDTSAALSDIAVAATSISSGTLGVLPVRRHSGATPAITSEPDLVEQRSGGPRVAATVGLNFDGMGNISGFVPP